MRKDPTEAATVIPSFGEVISVGIVAFFVCVCAACCTAAAKVYRTSSTEVTRERDERYVSLSEMEYAEDGQARAKTPGIGVDPDAEWLVPQVERRTVNLLAKRLPTIMGVCCAVTSLVATIIAILLLAFYPHYPSYNICSSGLDWRSILRGLEHLSLEAEYDIVLSVYNPNRFDFAVNDIDISLSYKGEKVATVQDNDLHLFPASSISDSVLNLKFLPSISQALSMQHDLGEGSLRFTANGNVGGYFSPLGWNYGFFRSVDDHIIAVGGDDDRSLCNCPQQ